MNVRRVESVRRSRRATKVTAALAAAALVSMAVPFLVASQASGAGGAPAGSATMNEGGFPSWYEDANGIRVVPCLDPNDANCLAPLAGDTFNPDLPLAFPSNYPDELFYSAADSQPITVSGTGCTASGGELSVHLALEASFINGAIVNGDQAVFGRIRLSGRGASGLCAGKWYTFRTPYGVLTLQVPTGGEIRGGFASANTQDIGCLPTPALPCDFDLVLQAPVLKVGLLRQATGAVPGYLGSAAFAPVVGGANGFNSFEVLQWPAGVTPQPGYGVDCDATCTVVGQTANFNVLAKLAGPIIASPTLVDFGGQAAGTPSAPRSITFTNLGSGPLGLDPTTIDHVAVTGPGAGQYAPSTTSCSIAQLTTPDPATAMNRDATCAIDVVFAPTGVGPAPATLEIWHTGATTPATVTLQGTGLAVEEVPGVSVTPIGGTVDFGDVRYRTASSVHDVVVTNTGTAPLQVLPAITAASHAGVFTLVGNTCPSGFVAPTATCTIGVRFVPSATGSASATLQIGTNVTGSETISLALVGNATGGVSAVASTLIDGFPEWYQDERGVRVGQCTDAVSGLCIAAPVTGSVVFPTNYPDESFFYIALSDDVVVADATCGATEGSLMVETGVEAAFASPTVLDGQQMTFGRVRFVAGRKGGLCPNTEYVVTYPYGRDTIQTDVTGAVKPSPGTTDVGCAAMPCDFSLALSSPVVEGFLQQTSRPAGYLGNPLVPGTVTGAPFVDPDTGVPANHVTIQRKDTMGQPGHALLGSTDRFGVSGRLAGPMVATPGALQFGQVEVDGATATLPVTYANLGTTDVTLAADPFGVSGTGDFTVGTTDCTSDLVLVPGATCTADIVFDPSTTGSRTADLVLRHSGQNDPLTVPLSGVGAAPAGQPAISAAPATVMFGDRAVGTISESQIIHVSNQGGSAPLTVGVPTVDAGAPFVLANDCVAPVAPEGSCGIRVQFAPAAAGPATATVTIPSDAGTVTVQVTGRGAEPGPAVAAGRTSANFPTWIQDNNGVRLEQCLVAVNCVLLSDATFDAGKPVAFPTNYPMESFYSIVDSDLITIPAQLCPDGTESLGGTALLRFATEATFLTPQPQAGAQSLFNRIRVRADGLCANMTYEFEHPYGTSEVLADGEGVINETFDSPDFVVNTTDPVLSGFLRWDPNVAPAAPAGHLGDGLSLHRIVGSNYRLDPAGEPVNHVAVRLPGGPTVARTDLFAVAGRLAGPVVAGVDSLDLGTVRQGHGTSAQHVTITNIGPDPVAALTVAFTGTDAAQFSASADSCTGAVLATDQSCSIDVVLTAAANTPLGVKSATLNVGHDGLRSPVTVALAGEVIFVGQPVLAVGPTSLAFGSATVGTLAPARSLVISNTGTGPMRMSNLVMSGTHANQFSVLGTSNAAACPMAGAAPTADIAPGASCTVSIGFVPTSVGSKAGSLVIAPTDPAGFTTLAPATVALTGTGVQGAISLSATTLTVGARAGRTGTTSVKLTNTGNANFSLAGNPALLFWDPATLTRVTTRYTATHNCNNVAPRRTCQVSISFAPGAGTVGQAYVVDLYMFGNVSNSVTDPLTGQPVGGVRVRVTGTRTR